MSNSIDRVCLLTHLELLMNWGPDNRHGATIDVCGNDAISFVPTLWGRDFRASKFPDAMGRVPGK